MQTVKLTYDYVLFLYIIIFLKTYAVRVQQFKRFDSNELG